MASVNKAILVGNVGKDPEVRHTPNGDQVTNLSLATTDSWKDKATGEKRDATEWHKVVFFGKLAEIAGQYLKKGSAVYIEGKIRTRKWQDSSGQDRYSTEIHADSMQMLGKKEDGAEPRKQERAPAQGQPAPRNSGGSMADFESDIPFAPIGRGIACHVI